MAQHELQSWWLQKLACPSDLYCLMKNQCMGNWQWVPEGEKVHSRGSALPRAMQEVTASAPHFELSTDKDTSGWSQLKRVITNHMLNLPSSAFSQVPEPLPSLTEAKAGGWTAQFLRLSQL